MMALRFGFEISLPVGVSATVVCCGFLRTVRLSAARQQLQRQSSSGIFLNDYLEVLQKLLSDKHVHEALQHYRAAGEAASTTIIADFL
jgi:hypothetical protein